MEQIEPVAANYISISLQPQVAVSLGGALFRAAIAVLPVGQVESIIK